MVTFPPPPIPIPVPQKAVWTLVWHCPRLFFIVSLACICVIVQSLSCVQLFETPGTAACQASLSFAVSCRLLRLMCIGLRKWKSLSSVWLFPTPWNSPWKSPGQDTGVGSHFFSRESSWPRDRTQVSRIAGGFFTSWATREEVCRWR